MWSCSKSYNGRYCRLFCWINISIVQHQLSSLCAVQMACKFTRHLYVFPGLFTLIIGRFCSATPVYFWSCSKSYNGRKLYNFVESTLASSLLCAVQMAFKFTRRLCFPESVCDKIGAIFASLFQQQLGFTMCLWSTENQGICFKIKEAFAFCVV